MLSLGERMSSYEDVTDIRLTNNLPVAIVLNGRSFRKLTSLIQKPFALDFAELMCKVMIKLSSDISDVVFVYNYNDIIVVIINNYNTDSWCNNDLQKIVSSSSSLASISLLLSAQQKNIKLLGEPIFTSKSFIIPSLSETINYLIDKQYQASNTAISMACFYELLKKYNLEKVNQMMKHTSIDERYNLLTNECNINLKNYPLSFWRGIACYRTAKLVNGEVRNKLYIDDELPFFSKDQSFLFNILKKN